MSIVSFGDKDDHAVVMYDRKTQECVIVANTVTHIQDSLAIVNSLKMRHAYIIAPKEAHNDLRSSLKCETMELYEYEK